MVPVLVDRRYHFRFQVDWFKNEASFDGCVCCNASGKIGACALVLQFDTFVSGYRALEIRYRSDCGNSLGSVSPNLASSVLASTVPLVLAPTQLPVFAPLTFAQLNFSPSKSNGLFLVLSHLPALRLPQSLASSHHLAHAPPSSPFVLGRPATIRIAFPTLATLLIDFLATSVFVDRYMYNLDRLTVSLLPLYRPSPVRPRLPRPRLFESESETTLPRCFFGAPSGLPQSFLGDRSELPRCSLGAPSGLPRSSLGAPSVLPRSSLGVPSELPRSSLGAPSELQKTIFNFLQKNWKNLT